MKKSILFLLMLVITIPLIGQDYVGPEKCLQCHSNMSGWRTSFHANGYSVVNDDSHSMQIKYGMVNDYDQNGVDDFKDGLNFNDISSVFDPYKPYAPILAYSAQDGYSITIGEVKYKVYLTYGGSGAYKQRYAVRIPTSEGESKDLYVSPIQYNEKTHEYVLYHPEAWYNDQNQPIYTSSSKLVDAAANNRSLTKGCAGCHTTGLEITQDQTTGEWLMSGAPVDDESKYSDYVNVFDIDGDGDLDQINTTCERCHGPGKEHANTADKTKIINPRNLTSEKANNICGMCHSRGKSKPNGTFSFPFDDENMTSWKVGDKVDSLYENHAGYWGDGKNSKKHHQQFYDFYTSSKPEFQFHKVTCWECHDVHNENKHHIRAKIEEEDSTGAPLAINVQNDNNTLCLACHATHGDFTEISKEMVANYDNNVNAIGEIVSKHTNHSYDPEGSGASRCSKCHMPKSSKSAVAYDIHSHTFEATPPAKTKDYQMPNSCAVSCHGKVGSNSFGISIVSTDEFTDWAGAKQQALADSLMKYYGPEGKWWNTANSVHVADLNVPEDYQLLQNYPNPFNPSTTIRFSLPREGHVKLNVYNAVGQLVATLVNRNMNAGNYYKIWNANNLASGVYFYRLEAKDFVQVKKMLLVK